MESNNTILNFNELNNNKQNLDDSITFSKTISKKEFIELDNLNNISEKNTSFSEKIVDETPIETKIEQLSYDDSKPHREILMVKQI